jgi:hypothetical protein
VPRQIPIAADTRVSLSTGDLPDKLIQYTKIAKLKI